MPAASVALAVLVLGGLAVAAGTLLVRSSGAQVATGRRLAGAPGMALPELSRLAAEGRLPSTTVRVAGRIRCPVPLVTPDGDRLAALHRDVEIRLPSGRWRVVERLRESRPVEIWERTAAVALDLGQVAEPLIAIPQVWEGDPAHLPDSYRPAVERLTTESGPLRAARATTRQLTLVDQVSVLAIPVRAPNGRLTLRPPRGGYVVSAVDLDVAMRLLAGPRRSRMLAGFGLGLAGAVLGAIGLVGLVIGVLP